ncbi:MAG: nucleotide sugar dehydrogenase, partial [Planctomycetota bacterium]
LAYKPDVDDTRESPAFEIIELLRSRGAEVAYADPFVPEAPRVRRHDLGLRSVELSEETVAAFDAVAIVTNHSQGPYELLAEKAQLVVDTRDAMRPWAGAMGDRLVRA